MGQSGEQIAMELNKVAKNTILSSERIKQTEGEDISQTPTYKPPITHIVNSTLFFRDNTSYEAEAIIHATGYNIHLPFLDKSMHDALEITHLPYSRISLYKHIFPPKFKNLAFIGFVSINNAEGSLHRILEYQSRYVGNVFSGKVRLPEQKEMEKDILKWKEEISKGDSYDPMRVKHTTYISELQKIINLTLEK